MHCLTHFFFFLITITKIENIVHMNFAIKVCRKMRVFGVLGLFLGFPLNCDGHFKTREKPQETFILGHNWFQHLLVVLNSNFKLNYTCDCCPWYKYFPFAMGIWKGFGYDCLSLNFENYIYLHIPEMLRNILPYITAQLGLLVVCFCVMMHNLNK